MDLRHRLAAPGSFLLEAWVQAVCNAGFGVLEEYFRPPGLPRARQPWHAAVFGRD